ncbi:MAG TPA: insulinase family protein [Planctomycetes bacterium]|nr:insulinase family protein [Planctomycetota bacterium]HIK60119.1 insulinase family protein [Planctomycetota bacterium]
MWLRPVILFAASASALAQEVPYERFQLENGLTVILHEDHRQPQVAVNTWYWVGAKEEEAGRSGFAHLFEHLMFRGTERAPGSSFDDLMEAGGGWNNASTSQDRTNYYDIGPSELLPTLLWLEADRMQALGPNIDQATLDNERGVVRNERRESYEDVPYGQADLAFQRLVYPPDHPYHIPVIGSHADLVAATVEDVHQFFASYYVPNNACLVVAGDFDTAATRERIERYFGAVPRGDDVRHVSAPPVVLDSRRVHTLTDDVPFARTEIIWPSPPFLTEGDAAMDLIGELLAAGVSSPLVQALIVESSLAEEVEAYQSSSALGSEFIISALARPGVSLDEVEAVIEREVREFLTDGPSEDGLNRQKALMEAQFLRRLESVEEKADLLNRNQFHFGEPDSFKRDLDRYRNATVDSCVEWGRKVLGQEGRVILRVVPLATPLDDPLATMPEVGPSPEFSPPLPERLELSNGIALEVFTQDQIPLVELSLVLPVGSAQDPAGKGGLGHLAGQMLVVAGGERDAGEFAAAMERLGADLSVAVGRLETTLHLRVLARHLDAALDLMGDALLRPRLDPADWERVQRAHLATLRVQAENPMAQARLAGDLAFLGAAHPYAHPSGGTPETVEPLLLNDVAQWLSDLFRPEGVRILSAGDLDPAALRDSLERVLGSWAGLASGDERRVFTIPMPTPLTGGPRLVFVDRPGATQTVIRWILPAPAESVPGRYARELVTTILGGTYTSRLNANLRMDKAITYGAGATLVHAPPVGYLIASAQVETQHTGLGVREFLAEFKRLSAGDIDDEELNKARRSQRTSRIEEFATLGSILDAAQELCRFGRTVESIAEELELARALEASDLNAAAKTLDGVDGGVLVLVGDKAEIMRQLADVK